MDRAGVDARTLSPPAMLEHAGRFALAAERLLGPDPSAGETLTPVPQYLLAHAIEFSLKAYLCARGHSEQDLRRLGRDLEAILIQALGEWLSTYVALEADEVRAVQLLNNFCAELECASLVTGGAQWSSFPELPLLLRTVKRLQEGVKPLLCARATERHHG